MKRVSLKRINYSLKHVSFFLTVPIKRRYKRAVSDTKESMATAGEKKGEMPDLFTGKFDIRIIDSIPQKMNVPGEQGLRKLEVSNILFRNDDHLVVLKPVKVLGRGVYGHVVGYTDKYDRTYAIKIEEKDGTEHTLLKKLPLCGQILSRVLAQSKKTKSWYIMLEFMNGTLDGNATYAYFKDSGLPSYTVSAAHIVEQVRRQVVCLLRANPELVYTDMKPENVLYRRNPDEKTFEVKLGDLGSLGKVVIDGDTKEMAYLMSFPCLPVRPQNGNAGYRRFDQRANARERLRDKLDCLSYQIGLLLWQLVASYFYEPEAVYEMLYFVSHSKVIEESDSGEAVSYNEELRDSFVESVNQDPDNKKISKAELAALAKLSELIDIDITKRRPIAKIEEVESTDGSTVMTLVDVPLIGNGRGPLPMLKDE